MCQRLFFGLKAESFDVVCMEARQVNAALSAMRNKTDKNDARGIAQVLRTGWFSPVHTPHNAAPQISAIVMLVVSGVCSHSHDLQHLLGVTSVCKYFCR